MKWYLTGGPMTDVTQALALLEGTTEMEAVLADKTYSAQKSVIAAIEQRQAQMVIPP